MKTTADIFLAGRSALEFWRATPAAPAMEPARIPDARMPSARDLLTYDERLLALFSAPLEIVVRNVGDRRNRDRDLISCSVRSADFHVAAGFRVAPGLVVASPELCFVQLANILPFSNLVMLGHELCGTYLYGSTDSDELGRRPRPLTTSTRLKAFAESAAPMRGASRAMQALAHVRDNAASPMEAVLGMLAGLPRARGGEGITAPQLNARIVLSPEARTISPHEYHVVDLFWPEASFGAEYDGRSVHARARAFDADRSRDDALKRMGIDLVHITAAHIRDDAVLTELFRGIAGRIGFRIQSRAYDETERRMNLRRELFGAAQGSACPIVPGARPQAPRLLDLLWDRQATGKLR